MTQDNALKKNVAGLWAGVFQALAYVAPAATAASFFVVEAGVAGGSVPLTFILATLGVASAMYMNYEFSKRISHAGGYYSYVSAGLGGRLGAFTGWLYYINVLGALTGFSVLFFAGVLWPLVPGLSAMAYGWIPLAFIPIVLIFSLLYFGLKPSLYYTMIGAVIEIVFVLAVSLLIIFSPNTHNTISPFTTMGNSFGNLGLATVYAILGFVGLGSVITISEELHNPKKIVPKAIVLALVIGAVVYIFSSYAFVVGWGVNDMSGFASATNPGFTVVGNYLGPIAMAIFIVITLNSFISNGIAEGNAFSRIGFALSRDKILFPGSMSEVHKATGSPRKMILFEGVLVTVISIAGGVIFGPFTGAAVITTLNGACLYIVHVFANISLPVYGRKTLKYSARKWLPFLLGPLPATAVYAFAVFGVFSPLPAYPINIASYGVILFVVVGLILAVYVGLKRSRADVKTIGLQGAEQVLEEA